MFIRHFSRILSYLLCLINMATIVYAQPPIPKSEIPSDIPADVKKQIERLYSSNPAERGRAAYSLGEMGVKATPATTFLIGILNDNSSLKWETWDDKGNKFKVKDGNDVKQMLLEARRKTSPGKEASKALKKIGKPILELYIGALKDKHTAVRKNAAEALGELEDPRAVEPLVVALKDLDNGVRSNIAKALGRIKDARAVEPLIDDFLKRPSLGRTSTHRVINALKEIKAPRTVELLIDALKDKHSDNREVVAYTLGVMKDPRAVEPLIVALNDMHSAVRQSAARALGMIGDSRAVKPLISALKDESGVSKSAASSLGMLKDNRAVEPLIAVLGSKKYGLKWNAAEALGKIGNPSALEPLIAALKDRDITMRRVAAKALGNIKDQRAVIPLIQSLKDKSRYGNVREAATALKQITGKDFGENPVKWEEWWERKSVK